MREASACGPSRYGVPGATPAGSGSTRNRNSRLTSRARTIMRTPASNPPPRLRSAS